MAERAGDWPGAAACCEGPRPQATFADLPLHHQDHIVRFAFVAAASLAYGITLGVLLRPVASRSLVSHAPLPAAAPPRTAVLDATAIAPAPPARPRSVTPRPLRTQPVLAEAELVAVTPQREPDRRTAAPPRQERRGNIFTRLLRGVWRTVQTPVLKADLL